MAATFSELVSYFELLASEHVLLRHTAIDKHFYRFELDEVLTGLAKGIKYPALVLEAYDFSYQEAGSDNIRKRRSGAFMLIDRVADQKDFNRIHQVWEDMEQLAEDILIRIRSDKQSRTYPVLQAFNIADVEGTQLSLSELGQHGIRVTFSLTSAVNCEIDTEKWL
jgi:hypothetical protein